MNNLIEIKFLGFDDWCREVFTTKKGTLVCNINLYDRPMKLCTKCNNEFYGEPDTPLKSDSFIVVDNFTTE